MRTVLVVAAESFEVKWITSRENLTFVKMAGGAGPALAAAAFKRAVGRFDAVVSAGLCGALDPALRVGDIFVADSVNRDAVQVPNCRTCETGPLASVDRVLGTADERRQMFREGFRAVEMEAAAVVREARELGLPCYCVKAVSDTADEEFKVDLNAARDESGRILVSRILFQAARRPVAIVPELLRLRQNAMTAARALGAFIATCNF